MFRGTLAKILVAITIAAIPFYAFLAVFGSSLVGHFTLLRLWDEVLLVVLLPLVIYWLFSDKKLRAEVFSSWLFRLIAAYIGLSLAVGLIALAHNDVTTKAFFYGLLVSTRFLIWFMAVWLIARRDSWLGRMWPKLVFWPLGIIAGFAMLQFFVLPSNFLVHFGYNKDTTYVPIITLNQNTDTIRVQSFLRGANQLGAYLVIIAGLLTTCLIGARRRSWQWLLAVLAVLALTLSFSRSAWLGSFVAVVVAFWLSLKSPRPKLMFWGAVSLLLLVPVCILLLFQSSHGLQDAFFHSTNASTTQQTSNSGHRDALQQGLHDLAHQPLGGGVGTAGQASWYNSPHVIRNTEDYFLQIGLETGWVGLALFVAIIYFVGKQLAQRQSDPLARGLLAALLGLIVVNLLSYGWVDDTLGFLFWGLAGIALGSKKVGNHVS